MSYRVVLFTIAMLVWHDISVNAAFRCYACTSSTREPNRKCEKDHFNTSVVGVKDCSMTSVCTTVIGPDFTSRGCGNIDYTDKEGGCTESNGTKTCNCMLDKCNGAEMQYRNMKDAATNDDCTCTAWIVIAILGILGAVVFLGGGLLFYFRSYLCRRRNNPKH